MREDVDTLVPQDRLQYILTRTAKEKEQTSIRIVNYVDCLCVERKNIAKDIDAYL